MYGLMRAGICSRNREQAYQRRLHYCGTCKTIGRAYGQQARLLLNNDAVFLAELLTALSPDAPAVREWNRAFQSFSCLALPKDEGESPLALQVAAAATLVMSEFKVADQLDDGGSGKWRLAQRVYSQGFCDASRRMTEWGFPLAAMWERYREQKPRESAVQSGAERRGVIQTLEYVAEPTAAVTGDAFRHGARVVGASEAAQGVMGRLGFAFGQLVYVLDALDDYEKDLKRGEFNALSSAFQLRVHEKAPAGAAPAAVPASSRATTEAYLWEIAGRIVAAIEALPITQQVAALFIRRLKTNLARRMSPEPPVRTSPVEAVRRAASHAQLWLRMARPQLATAGGAGSLPVHMSEEGAGTEVATTEEGSGDGNVPAKRGGGSGCGGDGCTCCCDGCDGCDCACCACEGCTGCGECCTGCGACGDACSGCGDCCSGCGSCIF